MIVGDRRNDYIKACEDTVGRFPFKELDEIETGALDSLISQMLEEDFPKIFRAKIWTKIVEEAPLHSETYVLLQEEGDDDTLTFVVTRQD